MLVQILGEIRELSLKGEYYEAYNAILFTVYLLRDKDQRKAEKLIQDGINNLNFILQSRKGTNWQRRRLNEIEAQAVIRPSFEKDYKAFSKILWDGKYMVDEGYGMVYSTERPSN